MLIANELANLVNIDRSFHDNAPILLKCHPGVNEGHFDSLLSRQVSDGEKIGL
jgi:hypothetical protein